MYSIPSLAVQGVSTTDIIGRLLGAGEETQCPPEVDTPNADGRARRSPFTTSSMFRAFSHEIPKTVTADTRVVYGDGSWDLFHAGHVSVLRQAVLLGDFVLVGVHDDAEVRRSWGSRFPILARNFEL